MNFIRAKFGKIVIGGIIGFITFVFVFAGILSPKATRGLHESAIPGTVNGDPITALEFNLELRQRAEFFKNMMGGKELSEEQLKAFGLRQMVFNELVRRKVMHQEAEKRGLLPSDLEVRERIQAMPDFQVAGKFDFDRYKGLLEANRFTTASFERRMREALAQQRWMDYFRERVRVSDDELKRHFTATEDQRKIKYVLLTHDSGKKDGMTDAQVAELRPKKEALADQVVALLSSGKASDASVNALLKGWGAEVKTSEMISRFNPAIPGIGNAPELMADLFAAQSPIDPTKGGKAKKYTSGAWVLVAVVTERKSADFAKFDAERAKLIRDLTMRKERTLMDTWIKKLVDRATIDANPSFVQSPEDAANT